MKIGFTAPLTGPLAGFGEANDFILAEINDLVADGIMLGDKSFTVEIITKDVESNSDTAATRAGELILDENVDLMIAIATPEMINPVADQCEANGVPCLSTLAPVAALLPRSWRRSRRRVRLDLPLLLGRRPARRCLRRDVGLGRHQQEDRSAVPERPRRQRRSPTRTPASPQAPRPPATPSSIPAASRTSPTTSRASSASSRTRASRSSSASRCRPTSPPSGRRPRSRTSTPSSSRWPRRCCSPPRSRRSATSATGSRARSGGRRTTRSRAR